MLQQMRNQMQGWILWLIISIIIGSLTLLSVDSYLNTASNKSNGIAAKVNNKVITQQQVSTISHQLRQQKTMLPFAAKDEQALRHRVIQQLVEQALLSEIGKQNGFNVSKALLGNVISKIPAFQEKSQFAPARFTALLAQIGYTSKQFLDMVTTELLASQLQLGILNTEFVLPDEISAATRMAKQKRDISYVTIPMTHYLAKINVTIEQAQQYYQANLATFQTVEQVRLDYLLLSNKEMIRNINPTTAQLQAFYRNTISNYTQPEQWRIARIVIANNAHEPALAQTKLVKITAALKAKQDFGLLARQFSDHPESAKNDGLLPWKNINTFPTIIKNAVMNLKPGDITAPIQTENGYEIVKLVAFKPQQIAPFSQVVEKLTASYRQQQAQKQFTAAVQQLQDATFQNSDSLAPAATALGLAIQTSDWLKRGAANKGWLATPQVLQAAFSDNVRAGNNSEVLYVDADTALVLRVKEYQAAKTLPFAQLEQQIKSLLASRSSQKQAQLTADAITQELNKGATLSQVTTKYGFAWTKAENISRYDRSQKINPLILQAAFELPRPANNKIISATNIVSLDKAIIVVALRAVHDPKTSTASAVEKYMYQAQLQRYYGELALAAIMKHYRNQATITIYEPQLIKN